MYTYTLCDYYATLMSESQPAIKQGDWLRSFEVVLINITSEKKCRLRGF